MFLSFILQKNFTPEQKDHAQAVDESWKLVKVDLTGAEVETLDDEEKEEKRKQELDQMKSAIVKLQQRLKKMNIEITKQEESFINKQKQLQEKKKNAQNYNENV